MGQLEQLRAFIFSEESLGRINKETADVIVALIDECLVSTTQKTKVTEQINKTITLLENSFNRANRHLDKSGIEVALSELVVSNAEARQELMKLSKLG